MKDLNDIPGDTLLPVYHKRLYSISELEELFGGTKWFWRTQIWDGRLAYVQVGKKILIDMCDLEKFIRDNKTIH